MAEGQEDRSSEDLSDEASPHRLEEYREQGRVAQSRELTGMIALMAAGTAIYVALPSVGRDLIDFMRDALEFAFAGDKEFSDGRGYKEWTYRAFSLAFLIVMPVALAGFITGILGSFAQVGSIFSTDPLKPDFGKINPLKGLQRFLSMKQFYDGLRMVVRAAIVAYVAYLFIKAEVYRAPTLVLTDPAALFGVYGESGKAIFYSLCAVFLTFAGVDYWIQRWEYMKGVRLTKKEAKEEHKEREGDPLIRSRIRSVQREMARKRMMEAVKKADVIITNPTHFAIAIVYDRQKMDAPRVVAKGVDFVAQRIKQVAADAGVPLVENVPLARTLYKTVKVGQNVPRALYQAVAEVLAYVYRLKNRRL